LRFVLVLLYQTIDIKLMFDNNDTPYIVISFIFKQFLLMGENKTFLNHLLIAAILIPYFVSNKAL
jgi:hypothetical protein